MGQWVVGRVGTACSGQWVVGNKCASAVSRVRCGPRSGQVRPGQVRSGQVRSGQVRSGQAGGGAVR